jgi:hypothetical protein
MREQEMRLRVFQFLKTRVRNMIMPATVGIGLAVGGCSSDLTMKYMAPSPRDASTEDVVTQNADVSLPSDATDAALRDTTLADAGQGPEASLVADAEAVDSNGSIDVQTVDAVALDGGAADQVTTKYIAPIPDAGFDSIATKYIAPVYIAPTPDAGVDSSPVVRYMAQMPDGNIASPMYMAPMNNAQHPA